MGPSPSGSEVPQLCLGDPGPGPTGARAIHHDRDGGLNCEHRQRQLACFLDFKLKDLPVNVDSDGPEASWHVRRRLGAAVGKTTSGLRVSPLTGCFVADALPRTVRDSPI